ncbi:SDR family oxidoreductase [Candidatus Microthrix sp.]|jgi:dTDP-4-dehydrorhamnose reductase|uniref:SDR family oxidoreductase n=1 Tax=Candidatus Neomicrothrix sp. TaxID=2719034 RepID=UPI001B616FD1|nr:sugar nucleotide-binding protein [Candidatus Microthrix sp.]MBK7018665.1 sugar nucleotide-binding protein [Candidatus Microthrix sp.]MBL0205752.1 sugar nucleotide-binding protein [Candidatus Microthrix sp.]MBP6133586.1 sugar nucleotide-binding protein [Candidatus Microthrix sp.]MBP6148557.1 sugar nucleotide-binding protein [Candidatus Microthrix sp.]MBP7985959.1 sugar nucleotide-binding protein [Candidatus Microthrix sp.]
MKILATGTAGMLGSSLVPALVAAGHDVVPTDINLADRHPWGPFGPELGHLDVRDRHAVREVFESVRPDFVAHLAAETSLEVSDANPAHAYLTNTTATKLIAQQCGRRGIPIVYISTAGVFDGTKTGAYTEFDEPNPINTYGDSKWRGEVEVAQFAPQHYIVRAGWMVGGGAAKDHKFVSRILDQVRAGRTTLHAVGDKLGTPTYTTDFAACLLNLIDSEVYGLYHMACEGEGTRYDVAAEILSVLGRDDIDLVEVTSEFFAEEFPSMRPYSEIMINQALDLQGMNLMRPWREALAHYLSHEFADLLAPAASLAM